MCLYVHTSWHIIPCLHFEVNRSLYDHFRAYSGRAGNEHTLIPYTMDKVLEMLILSSSKAI